MVKTGKVCFLAGAILAAASIVMPAYAENLHQEYGPTWNCGYITTGLSYTTTRARPTSLLQAPPPTTLANPTAQD